MRGALPAWRKVRTTTAYSAAVLGAVAVVAWCAGCTSGAARPPAATSAPSASRAPSASATKRVTEPALPARALRSPGCSTAVSGSGALSSVRTAMFAVPGNPFGVAVTPDGRWAFAADSGGSIEVFRVTGPLTLVPVRSIPVPGSPLGEAITPTAGTCSRRTVTGRWSSAWPGRSPGRPARSPVRSALPGAAARPGSGPGAGGAIEVAVSPDGRFAFVSLENAARRRCSTWQGSCQRVRPRRLRRHHPARAGPGRDGRLPRRPLAVRDERDRAAGEGDLVQQAARGTRHAGRGLAATGETDPAASVVATVDAGCSRSA